MTLRSDERFMQIAVALARRGLGNVSPNPAVGCVIVRNDAVQGRGWTQPGGRPHAETEALAQAGDSARGGKTSADGWGTIEYAATPTAAIARTESRA